MYALPIHLSIVVCQTGLLGIPLSWPVNDQTPDDDGNVFDLVIINR